MLLFDIDSTMLDDRASAAHGDAILSALQRVYGLRHPGALPIQTAGKTDLQIARQTLEAYGHGTVRFHALTRSFCSVAAREHAARCPADLSEHVIAGIPDLLTHLSARGDVLLGLLTGNICAIGHLKLMRAGLKRFFAHAAGGYGGDAEDRAALTPIARARAGTFRDPHPRERTWIIGDTPDDIRCAHADQVRCFAVTTGPYTAAHLRAADYIADNATELRQALDRELNRRS